MDKYINKKIILNVVIGFLVITLVTNLIAMTLNTVNVHVTYENYSSKYDSYWNALQVISIIGTIFAALSVGYVIYRLVTINKYSKVKTLISICALSLAAIAQVVLCIVLYINLRTAFVGYNINPDYTTSTIFQLPDLTSPDLSTFIAFQSNTIIFSSVLIFFIILEIIGLVSNKKNSQIEEVNDESLL